MTSRTTQYCPHCNKGLRLLTGKSGHLECPHCQKRIKADTTELGLAMLESWWVPKWYWLVLTIVVVYGFLFWSASDGYNPMRGLSAMFWGGIAGGTGALIGGLFKYWKHSLAWVTKILASLGFVLGTAASKGISQIAGEFVSQEFIYMTITGMAASSLSGLIPHFAMMKRNPKFGSLAFWACVLVGSFGGLLLSLPLAMVLLIYGRKKYNLIEQEA